MADTLVIAEEAGPDTGYRFAWGIAFAGGVAAAAVIFFLLTLGAGFGLLLVHPLTGGGVSAPAFLTGGAIYFLVAQAFGFAVGGHVAGRLMGPLVETEREEELRAALHGLVVWAVGVLAAVAIVIFAGMLSAGSAASTAALYGSGAPKATSEPVAYLVDRLFRPEGGGVAADSEARAEAARIFEAGLLHGEQIAPDDHARLVMLTAREARIAPAAAEARVDATQADVQNKARKAADFARKAASYASLWLAFSLLFGAIVAMASAVFARIEEDKRLSGQT